MPIPPVWNPDERIPLLRRSGRAPAPLSVVVAISLLLLLSGCPKPTGSPLPFEGAELPDPQALYLEIRGHGEQVRTLQGTAQLRLQTGQGKASLDAVIACDREGRLRFEVLDWLNHVVFLGLFDHEGFLTYSAAENQYVQGPDEAERIQEILGMPLRAEELAALALGDPFFLPLKDPILRVSVDQGALLLDAETAGPGPRYLVWLDAQKMPARMVVLDPCQEGRGIGDLLVEYGRYRKTDSVFFPYRIRVVTDGSKRVLQVDYERVVLNESLEQDLFRFLPPPGATRSGEQ